MQCIRCKHDIDPERLEVKPDAKYCLACAQVVVKRRRGFMDYPHKTGSSLVMFDPSDEQTATLAMRYHKRSR